MTTLALNRVNGATTPATVKVASKGKVARKAKATIKPSAARTTSLHRWAQGTVVGSVALSAWLNGLSASMHAPQAWQGWLIGVSIPLLVLALGRVATLGHAMGYRRSSIGVAAAGIGLLALSVWHCAEALAGLTGSHIAFQGPGGTCRGTRERWGTGSASWTAPQDLLIRFIDKVRRNAPLCPGDFVVSLPENF